MASNTPISDAPEQTWFVNDYLLYLLAAVSEAASAEFHQKVRSTGLRVPEWRVLACLFERDGAMITHLAKVALVEQSRLTRIIVQMEERGLLKRQDDPADRRRVRVFIADEGRALVANLVPHAQAHEQRLLDNLPPSASAEIKTTLRALLANLEHQER